MTEQELEIRRKALKSVLDELDEKEKDIINQFEEHRCYIIAGFEIAKSIVECAYKAEPMCLTVGVQ